MSSSEDQGKRQFLTRTQFLQQLHPLVQDALGITEVPREDILRIRDWLDSVQIIDYQAIAFALKDLNLHQYLYQIPHIMWQITNNLPLLEDDNIAVLDQIVKNTLIDDEASLKQARQTIDAFIKENAYNKEQVRYWGQWGMYL